jgi:uncharacterized repeat protein (TIGR01451 family)
MSTLRNSPRFRDRRRLSVGAAVILAVAAVFGSFFAAATGATLTPSAFEGNDGNMTIDTPGNTDWASLSGDARLRTVVDLPSGQGDNAFGTGTKEDDTGVTVVTGSIPPNKNDLTRAYVYNDQVGGSSFVYLAWERAAAIGDAHIDFELNQNPTPGFDGSTTGNVTLNRTTGDLLLAYDFGGSGTPDITLFTWDGSAWGDQQDLSALGFAEAAVNTVDLPDLLDNNATVAAGEFGEASVNLSDALIAAGFTPDTCESFGSIMVKARSSGSSTDAELKDFIAPAPFHASNCASPSITTMLSSSSGNDGAKVHDSATLTGATADAGGTVTYSVYNNSACTVKVADGGTVKVENGMVPNSSDVTFDSPGTYYWQAAYSGDSHNNPATSTCTDEQLVIAPLIDLAVTKAGAPASQQLGAGNITWTMIVTNNGPDTATGVTIADPMPAGNTFVSASTTQGSCTGGAVLHCSLGTIAAGGSVTITLVTTPTAAGTVTNTVTVAGNETETNHTNNTATASVEVNQFTPPPPVYCVAVSRVTPNQLYVGRKTTLTIHVTQHGKAVKGIHVRITGPKINARTKASNRKGVIKQTLKMKRAGILVFAPIAGKACNTKRVGVTNVFTPPVTG